jgi:hypothetical protein
MPTLMNYWVYVSRLASESAHRGGVRPDGPPQFKAHPVKDAVAHPAERWDTSKDCINEERAR